MRLEGKTAIVTGCGRGIGFEISKKFLLEGATVAGCDINQKNMDIVKNELQVHGKFETFKCDVSNFSEVSAFVDSAVSFFGKHRVDILVNNAGIGTFMKFVDIGPELWQRTLDVNLTGAFNMCKAVVPIMIENGSGVILNMSSTNGLLAEEGLSHYNASKAGIVLLTKSLALELGKHGIRAVSICPGFILTEIQREAKLPEEMIQNYINKIPIGRYGKAEDVANAFVFLASNDASFITGSELVVDGGQICQE